MCGGCGKTSSTDTTANYLPETWTVVVVVEKKGKAQARKKKE